MENQLMNMTGIKDSKLHENRIIHTEEENRKKKKKQIGKVSLMEKSFIDLQ